MILLSESKKTDWPKLDRFKFLILDLLSARRVSAELRSAAKTVEQSLGYGYLSKMEWFSLHHQHV
jgi:hypothetical protein